MSKILQKFDIIKTFYSNHRADLLDSDTVKKSLSHMGTILTPKEVDKFIEKYPDIDAEDFIQFLTDMGAIKQKAEKLPGSGGMTKLNTAEKAELLGIPEEFVNDYINGMSHLLQVRNQFQEWLGTVGVDTRKHPVTLTIPERKPKAKKEQAEQT